MAETAYRVQPEAAAASIRDFAEVAEAVAPRLFRIAVRMCGRREEADDLVQDTLLQAFRNWHQFQGRANPSTWLYTIAARLCQRRHRRRAGEPARMESLETLLPSPSDPIPVLVSSDDPLDAHASREAEAIVGAAIASLPRHYRLPLVLAEIAELSPAEIAGILGLKQATVKTRIHRGRLAIRRALVDRLPSRPGPPAGHSRQVCLDLLAAKQEALDRHAPFPFSSEELCARCQSLFRTLDLGREACIGVQSGELPSALRALIRAGAAAEPAASRTRVSRTARRRP